MSDPVSRLKRPALTLPAAAAQLVREEYAKAKVILEYGSGGSTVVAGEVPGATVFSVESDKNWVAMMEAWFAENPPVGTVHLHHVDIGPTRDWGHPVDHTCWERFVNYPYAVWNTPDFVDPDVVLIDGRFRLGCFFATLFQIKSPTIVLFDDYADRPGYHAVEKFAKPITYFDRLAFFLLEPTASPSGLKEIISLSLRPR